MSAFEILEPLQVLRCHFLGTPRKPTEEHSEHMLRLMVEKTYGAYKLVEVYFVQGFKCVLHIVETVFVLN